MEPDDAVSGQCPSCGDVTGLIRASSAVISDEAADADPYAPAQRLDPRLPPYMLWSVFQFAAIACMLAGAMVVGATSGNLPATVDPLFSVAVALAATAALIGMRNTARNRAMARELEPGVRAVHEHAVYCRSCECVYFDARDLPRGLAPFDPMPVADYRWRLWDACGFVRRP